MNGTVVRNILFVMCDQLRADHLGCYGHPTLATPNIDALARRGVRFENAFVQSAVCGPSRMSFYTGRYVSSHRATWNLVPLSVAEPTIGDWLRPHGLAAALAGKSHVIPDRDGMARLGIDPKSPVGRLRSAGGFIEVDRYDGHHPPGDESGYGDFLRTNGYASRDPWSDFVISVADADGAVRSGWQMRHANLPARVADAHSETAYMTDRALSYIDEQGERPWFLHLSYVKPHWPYVAPAPWNAKYRSGDLPPTNRDSAELITQHPVLAAYRRHEESSNFRREEVVRSVKPVYMGLIAQIDHHLGRLLSALEARGRMQDTLVLFTADHGDFMGDHFLGEKELPYDEVLRFPLIVFDPDPAADARRGTAEMRPVEAIDILPTILDALRIPLPQHWLEGRSLLPLLHGPTAPWRDAVFSELDWSFREARLTLGLHPADCYIVAVRTERWKYVRHAAFPPQLFDLRSDRQERHDIGQSDGYEHRSARSEMADRIADWSLRLKKRNTVDEGFVHSRTSAHKQMGVRFGEW